MGGRGEDSVANPLIDKAGSTVAEDPENLKETPWRTPAQGKLDRESAQWKDGEGERLRAVKLITRRFEADWAANGSKHATQMYIPKLPNIQGDMANMSTTLPPDANEFPGGDIWELITKESWQHELLTFALDSAFELMDLQSDITMCVSIAVDDSYDNVPKTLKALFCAITALCLWLELAIAIKKTRQVERHEGLAGFHWWSAMTTTSMLNYLAAPVELMVAPMRLGPFGANDASRNLGSVPEQPYPLVYRGGSGMVDYLNQRTFFVRLPKIFLENIVLWSLLLYIQHFYVRKWTGAALFATFFSFVSVVLALRKACRFLVQTRKAKRYFRTAVEDTQQITDERFLKFARQELSMCPMSCPLL